MTAPAFKDDLVTRREAIRRVSALLGGAALIGQSAWLAGCATTAGAARELFSESDVVLLDEIADTILPETKTPGAKAAGVGPFIATMVSGYLRPARAGACFATASRRSSASRGRRTAAASWRRRRRNAWRCSSGSTAKRSSTCARPGADERPHYFRMIKELTLLGYFTSEIGYTQAMRYVETPGRFEPCITYTTGDKAWAPHA